MINENELSKEEYALINKLIYGYVINYHDLVFRNNPELNMGRNRLEQYKAIYKKITISKLKDLE